MVRGNYKVNPLGKAISDGIINDKDVLELGYSDGTRLSTVYYDGMLLLAEPPPREGYTFEGFGGRVHPRLDFVSWKHVGTVDEIYPEGEQPEYIQTFC